LNPRPPDCKSNFRDFQKLGSINADFIDWDSFYAWLVKERSKRYAMDLFNYAKKYCHCLFSGDLSEIAMLNVPKRRMVMASLSNLAKFLGVYDEWRRMVHRFGIKWVTSDVTDRRIIDRLTKVSDPGEIYEWVKAVKKARPDLEDFMDFMAITGLRLVEAVRSYNLIIQLSRNNRLSNYYNEEKEALEHFRYEELFLRKGKKAFVSFVPKQFVRRISQNKNEITKDTIVMAVKRMGLKQRFSDLRELHGSVLTRYLSESEINFLHGRIGASVFMQNYFNIAWIKDLKKRLFMGINEILKEIS